MRRGAAERIKNLRMVTLMPGGDFMDHKNDKSASRDNFKDIPDEVNIDFENDDSETLKKLGRQVEV